MLLLSIKCLMQSFLIFPLGKCDQSAHSNAVSGSDDFTLPYCLLHSQLDTLLLYPCQAAA